MELFVVKDSKTKEVVERSFGNKQQAKEARDRLQIKKRGELPKESDRHAHTEWDFCVAYGRDHHRLQPIRKGY